MSIYLPIAEMSLNMLILIGMGVVAGFFSGLFGIGGGFLITPLLIFYNIPPAIAVGTGANQMIASSVTGAITHFRRRTLDIKLGILLAIGGGIGSLVGIQIFSVLKKLGQLDLMISFLYVLLLGSVGSLMIIESWRDMLRQRKAQKVNTRLIGRHNWIHRLPLKMRFRTSMIYISIIPVLGIGLIVGLLSSIMGIGGGFFMIPALIYLLRVPTSVVIGTSLFQITFVSSFTTVLQSVTNQSVDIVLAFLLMLGGSIGAQYGTRAGRKLKAEQLRLALACLVLIVCMRLAFQLFIRPDNLFSLDIVMR
ncbi:sulfite exporter TauE/SafE family protein [Bartonella henselae]|uniref:sulfite exporter TauE/SafE family protein n=1 Tax=Bartonella henselae TaxID=38323 RepID=UPI0009606482|nr:sulfite exporter TauE/SafE family protein [Bartonella henselae]OLL54959.1 permease [Bartonella henselae]OLL56438.1 permease [Bartonella henselae]UJM33438.1 sulfite exporter TauE/SafE family protein [Bartonella henselae]